MSVLETLPNEISTEIFSYLPPATLAAVSRLSRQLFGICRPLMYKSLIIRSPQCPGPSPLQTILRSLLTPGQDRLATYIRSVHVLSASDAELDTEFPADLALFTAAANSLGLTQSPSSHAGQLLLLLHLVNRLHILTLSSPYPSTDVFLAMMEAFGTSTPSPVPPTSPASLRHLREFYCSHGTVTSRSLVTLLQLPSIRKIDVHHFEPADAPRPTLAAATNTSHVTNLRLVSGCILQHVLKQLLEIPLRLTHFSLIGQSQHIAFPIRDLAQVLQPLRETLEYLHIDVSNIISDVAADDTYLDRYRLPPFHEWPVLHTISTSMSTLLGRGGMMGDGTRLADVVPRGLRELDIRRDRFWSLQQEAECLTEMLLETAGIERLAVGRGRGGLRSMDGLVAACKDAGIVLRDNGSDSEIVQKRGVYRVRHMRCRRSNVPR